MQEGCFTTKAFLAECTIYKLHITTQSLHVQIYTFCITSVAYTEIHNRYTVHPRRTHFLSALVGPGAHVVITKAICLWHFALFLSSPTTEQTGFIAPRSQENPQRHTHTQHVPYTHTHTSTKIRAETEAKEMEGTWVDTVSTCTQVRTIKFTAEFTLQGNIYL